MNILENFYIHDYHQNGTLIPELPKCVLGHPYNKENSEKTVLVHLLVQII
jgi:hypothetical protein